MNISLILIVFLLNTIPCLPAFASGNITGTIKFEGTAPKAKVIRMDADAMCLAKQKDAVYSQTFVLGEGGTLGNVFVYVKSGLGNMQYPVPSEPAVLDQKGCTYLPHVMAVRVGQKVKFLNPDGTLHNVHAVCKVNPEFNAAMPNFRTEMEKVFNKPEMMFQIRCDVHPWMSAWMAVMSHPYFTITKKDGQFALTDLPSGTYEIEAWHEKLGTQTAKVTVINGANEKIDFTFSAPK